MTPILEARTIVAIGLTKTVTAQALGETVTTPKNCRSFYC